MVLSWVLVVPAVRAKAADLAAQRTYRTALEQRKADLESLVTAFALPVGTTGALPISDADLLRSLPEQRLPEDLYAMIEKIGLDLGIADDFSVTVSEPEENLTDATVDAAAPVVASAIAEAPVQIVTKASYDAAKQLLDRLTTTLRPIKINAVSLAPTDTGAIAITVRATAYTRAETSTANNETNSL